MSSQTLNMLSGTIISQAPDQIASELEGEAVILNLNSGTYYGLNEVGARIWQLIQQPCTFDQILHVLLAEYNVQPEVCEQDLTKILTEMKDARLIEVKNDEEAA